MRSHVGVWMLVLAGTGLAAADASKETKPAEIEATLPPHVTGPKLVDLGNSVELDLPAGMILIERVEAKKLLANSGNDDDAVVAIVEKIGADWAVVIDYAGVGYVDDGDANELDPKELLEDYRKGTEEQNKRRKSMGIEELFLDGWSEMPRYDKAAHHLVWGLKGHSASGPAINYFTRILGRGGYLSVDLIDSADRMEASKVDAAPVLAATRFKPGQRYEDHRSDDKSSGMGLRTLVIGGTGIAIAAKAGFFTKIILPVLIALKKAIIFIAVGVAALFRRLFRRKDKAAAPPPADPGPTT